MAWQGLKLSTLANDTIAVPAWRRSDVVFALDAYTPGAGSANAPAIATNWRAVGCWFNDAKTRNEILVSFEFCAQALMRALLAGQKPNLAAARPYNDASNQWYDNGDGLVSAAIQRPGQGTNPPKVGVAAGDSWGGLIEVRYAPGVGAWDLDTGDTAGRTVVLHYDYGTMPMYAMQCLALYRELLPQFIPVL